MNTLHEDRCTYLITPHLFLLRLRKVADKSCRENQNTHFMLGNALSKIVPFVRLKRKSTVQPDSPQMTIRRMRIACWIPTAINTLSERVVFFHCYSVAQIHLSVTSYVRCTYK